MTATEPRAGVCVGVHVHAEPERLLATLASLTHNTGRAIDLVLLPDGPDRETAEVLAGLHTVRQSGTVPALGTAACFNRLVASSRADVLVLLESGAQVGPGWLDLLLAALWADPRNGLAGPSTNHAWNQQAAFPGGGDRPEEIARTAAWAAAEFGLQTRSLGPLHSLSDFCYAARREVVDAVGAADEGYGLGPCWELDYNVRAARAGYRAVWAVGAYVHRAPFTARRAREEARRFDASRRRYQDRHCALRRLGERVDYEPHCRGDDCEHFAPPPLPASPAQPLVSCIMPTGGRPEWALQSVRYFQRQDYRPRELVIVDDGVGDLAARLPRDDRIRYVRSPAGLSIGAKRNRACELARGSIIAHWDDDDWYAPRRLRVQVAPLLDGWADITALGSTLFFDVPAWQFWRCSQSLHRRLFAEDVHGGTLVYRRTVWERSGPYPDASLAEDAAFLTRARHDGARLRRLPGDGLFIYVRHGRNAWSFTCGAHLDSQQWELASESPLPAGDQAFYAAQSARKRRVQAGPSP